MSHPLLRRAAAGFAVAAVVLAAGIASAAAESPKFAAAATSFTLDNGLQVVVIPSHRAPVVTHMVWYRVGAADDPLGKSGIAHFLEHLMFKGTTTHPEGEFSSRVEAVGGDDNAFTTDDVTVYHQTVAKQHLALMMQFEADRMANLTITDAALLPERQVILEERAQRIDNNPGTRLGEAMSAALYQNSHYSIPTIGWAHEMATLDRADALAFYNRWYTPNNAIVVVAGDVTEDEVRKLAEETYGKLPRRFDPAPRVRLQEPPPQAARVLTLADPRVTQPSVHRIYLTPSRVSGDPAEAAALDLLSDILGGGSSSRLYRQLVVEQGIAAAAGTGYDTARMGDGTFSIGGSPRGDATPEQLAAAFDKVIADLIENGISDDELARAKERVRASSIYSEDNPTVLARVVGQALATGLTLEQAQHWPSVLDAVTRDEVVAVARKYLDLRRSVTGYLVNAPAEGRS